MLVEQSRRIVQEVGHVLIGKDDVIEKTLMAIYAGGHVLLEDFPGTGKTTLALALSRAMDLDFKRIQFTPDTMPSDITGFSVFNRDTANFEFRWGAVNCNLLLGDEINRTSAKTQAALLEVMEEFAVTVDGVTRAVPKPFVCIATQNPVGSAGTQPLPDSQLDRFMVRLSVGYPSVEDQATILRQRGAEAPYDQVNKVIDRDELIAAQAFLDTVTMSEPLIRYIVDIVEATRRHPMVELGISPRGMLAAGRMARACSLIRERDYVIPEDVQEIADATFAHRLVLKPQARIQSVDEHEVIAQVMAEVKPPVIGG